MQNSIGKILSRHKKVKVTLKDFKPSAVLVPLFTKDAEDYLLFTVRNDKVRHHKGEVCFPGGVYDKKDRNLLTTALREVKEELGIKEKDVEILGELDDLITPTFYRITPFVGRIPYPYPLKMSQKEISTTLEIPLNYFMDEKRLHVEHFEYFGESFEIPFYKWKNHSIWGATGRIVRQLVEVMKK